ncbi:hypothetical protein TNCV_107001 [Trichonephila clavipes]|nr:hypothetical protein TNCV_107001 [Trichonephila clavipes]
MYAHSLELQSPHFDMMWKLGGQLRCSLHLFIGRRAPRGPDKLDLTRFSGYKFRSSSAKGAFLNSKPNSVVFWSNLSHRLLILQVIYLVISVIEYFPGSATNLKKINQDVF